MCPHCALLHKAHVFFSFDSKCYVGIFPAAQCSPNHPGIWGIFFLSLQVLCMHLFIYWHCFEGLSGLYKSTRLLLVLAFGSLFLSCRLCLPAPVPQPNSVNRLSHLDSFQSELNASPGSASVRDAQSALGWKSWTTLSPQANTSRYEETVLNVMKLCLKC